MVLQIGGVVIAAGLTIGLGVIMARKNKSTGPDINGILGDFKAIKTALIQFKKNENALIEDIRVLKKHMKEDREIDWSKYGISKDQQYLVIKNAKDSAAAELVQRVGGTSSVQGNRAYLSFMSIKSISKVKAEANFKIIPAEGYKTTTNVEYDTSGCVAEDDEIIEYEWENKESRFPEPGIQIIRLRIQDKNGNWSDWAEKQIVVSEEKGVREIEAGVDALYVIHNNGKVDGFGRNEFGQMGAGFVGAIESRQWLTQMENVKQLSAGEYHCLMATHDNKVYSCGRNNYGQLGHGNRTDSKVPRQIWGMENILQVSAGYNFSAAVSSAGHIFTWGNNEHNQLGNEENYYREIPKRIDSLKNMKKVALGATHALALGYDGNVYAWGDNRNGELGLGFKGKSNEPTMSEISKIKDIAAGRGFSLAVTEAGRVLGWGNNSKSQLGISGENEVLFAQEVPYLKNIVQVKALDSFAMAIDDIGHVYTWGTYRTLDDVIHDRPTKVDSLKYVKSIAAGNEVAFALKEDEEIVRWNTNLDDHVPVLFSGLQSEGEEVGGELNNKAVQELRRK